MARKIRHYQDNGQAVAQIEWDNGSITTIRRTGKPPHITHSDAAIFVFAAVITFFAVFEALVYVISFT